MMKLKNDAINVCLSALAEPILSEGEDFTGVFEAEQAEELIKQITREVLSIGWYVNTDEEWTFLKDDDEYITVPLNTLKVIGNDVKVTLIGTKLYNKEDYGYKFPKHDKVDCQVIWDLEYDELPYSFQRYIALKSARTLVQRLSGESVAINLLLKDEAQALFLVKQEEYDTADHNIFDEASVSRIVNRSSNPTSKY